MLNDFAPFYKLQGNPNLFSGDSERLQRNNPLSSEHFLRICVSGVFFVGSLGREDGRTKTGINPDRIGPLSDLVTRWSRVNLHVDVALILLASSLRRLDRPPPC